MGESIFDIIKRLKLSKKSILEVVNEIDKLRTENADLRERLMALLAALEVKEIGDLMNKTPEHFKKLGEVIKDNIT
jgi:regulator of replication initiation timing